MLPEDLNNYSAHAYTRGVTKFQAISAPVCPADGPPKCSIEQYVEAVSTLDYETILDQFKSIMIMAVLMFVFNVSQFLLTPASGNFMQNKKNFAFFLIWLSSALVIAVITFSFAMVASTNL